MATVVQNNGKYEIFAKTPFFLWYPNESTEDIYTCWVLDIMYTYMYPQPKVLYTAKKW